MIATTSKTVVDDRHHMCRETVEGQAVELGWIRRREVPARDEDYFYMSTKKTGFYTCISPCRLGAICAGETRPEFLDRFNEVFRLVGIAFQIQDDVLNLLGDEALYDCAEWPVISMAAWRQARPSPCLCP